MSAHITPSQVVDLSKKVGGAKMEMTQTSPPPHVDLLLKNSTSCAECQFYQPARQNFVSLPA